MLNTAQLQYLHAALRDARTHRTISDEDWRMILRNTGKVHAPAGIAPSSRNLSNEGFEDVMAMLESLGFVDRKKGEGYWRRKVQSRGSFASAPAVYKIHRMSSGVRYPVAQLCEKFSEGRTCIPEKLTPLEAHKLIEMLKDVNDRERVRNAAGDYQRPELGVDLFSNRAPVQTAEARRPAPVEKAAVPCACEGEEPPF